MRKPRDYDSELRALDEKARALKERKIRQLGELVIACRADDMPMEILAGALLDATETRDATTRERWRVQGAGFFRRSTRSAKGDGGDRAGDPQSDRGALPSGGAPGAS